MTSEFIPKQRHRRVFRTASLLLALWTVVIFGFLLISFLSASCLSIDCHCTAEFIDGARQAAYLAFQIQCSALLLLFMTQEIFQPINLLQAWFNNSCCPAWHLFENVSPPPRLAV